MSASRLLSDMSWLAVGLGIGALLIGAMWRRTPGGPDPDDPDPNQRFMASYKRAMERFARPLFIGGAGLLVLAVILVIASRLVP